MLLMMLEVFKLEEKVALESMAAKVDTAAAAMLLGTHIVLAGPALVRVLLSEFMPWKLLAGGTLLFVESAVCCEGCCCGGRCCCCA